MKRLLIAYDGSPCSDAALDDLSRAGLPADLEVTVISVAEVWLPPNPDQVEPVFPDAIPAGVRKAREQALQAVEVSRTLAERTCERLKIRFPQWRLQSFAAGDSPAWAVVKKADAWRAELVVLGSHGRSILERLFLGSVASKVAAEAHCSVRIARPRRHAHASRLRVVVAVDGSSDSDAAIQSVVHRNWPSFAEFRIITVIDPRLQTAMAWPTVDSAHWSAAPGKDVGDWVAGMTDHFAGKLRKAGLNVETHVFDGDPKHVLPRQAEDWEADSLFLGARGLHHGNRLFLGSLASAVAARAHCSVEIVRP